jgi:hypothetical protein
MDFPHIMKFTGRFSYYSTVFSIVLRYLFREMNWLVVVRITLSVLGIIASLLAAGCGNRPILLESPITKLPLTEPAAVPVEIVFAKDLRNHVCTGDNGYIAHSWTFEMGPPSIVMFDLVFSALFDKTQRVSRNSDVIELHLKEFNGCEASWPIIGTTQIRVTYEAIIRSAGGDEIARWEGRGTEGPNMARDGNLYDENGHLTLLTREAMREAAADFIVSFYKNPKVQTWIEKRSASK